MTALLCFGSLLSQRDNGSISAGDFHPVHRTKVAARRAKGHHWPFRGASHAARRQLPRRVLQQKFKI
jgi:hypothetical protein